MQIQKFDLALLLAAGGGEFQHSGLVAVDSGHNTS